MAKNSPIMDMIFELFLIGSVGVSAIAYVFSANWDTVPAVVVTMLTTVLATFFAVVVIKSWWNRAH